MFKSVTATLFIYGVGSLFVTADAQKAKLRGQDANSARYFRSSDAGHAHSSGSVSGGQHGGSNRSRGVKADHEHSSSYASGGRREEFGRTGEGFGRTREGFGRTGEGIEANSGPSVGSVSINGAGSGDECYDCDDEQSGGSVAGSEGEWFGRTRGGFGRTRGFEAGHEHSSSSISGDRRERSTHTGGADAGHAHGRGSV